MRIDGQSMLGGGAIAGLLRFQNEDLAQGAQPGGPARGGRGRRGERPAAERGLNLQQPYGSVASQPLFALGAPQALAQAGNARDATVTCRASASAWWA